MNRFERRPIDAGEAKIEYMDGEYRVVRPGALVRCAFTGEPIPLEELRYWSVDWQEAYSSPAASMKRDASAAMGRSDSDYRYADEPLSKRAPDGCRKQRPRSMVQSARFGACYRIGGAY